MENTVIIYDRVICYTTLVFHLHVGLVSGFLLKGMSGTAAFGSGITGGRVSGYGSSNGWW